jgi:hypothetical protein
LVHSPLAIDRVDCLQLADSVGVQHCRTRYRYDRSTLDNECPNAALHAHDELSRTRQGQ